MKESVHKFPLVNILFLPVKILSWLFLLFSPMFALFFYKGSRANQQPTFNPAAIDEFIERQMEAGRVPGMGLAIIRDDQVLYLKGYGSAHSSQTVTPQTQFLIASLSKSFTALAVMQLVESGKIDLDASVQTYLPEFTLADPVTASQITIRQLLNHTSGLSDAGFPAMRLPQPATPAERVLSLRTARPVAQPGTEYHYFNVNYEILARVVEVASGQSFSEYLQEHIFAPLRMVNTISTLTSTEAMERASSLAQGHLNLYGIPIASAEETGYYAGNGGIVSTAADMANYLMMQANGGRFEETQLLSPEGTALMHTPPMDISSDYGMGWIATTRGDQRVLEHNGILSTFYADMVLLPDSGYGMALLYNIHSVAQASLGFPQIKGGLIDILQGEEPPAAGFSVITLEIIFGILTLAGTAMAVRSLLRLPRWAEWARPEPGERARTTPAWRLAPGILWTFVPAAIVVAMPTIVLTTSGRAFGYITLFRSMPEVMIWLGLTGVLGVINGSARMAVLARRTGRAGQRRRADTT